MMIPTFTVAPPLVAVIGPTAVGKSALALEICERYGGEIITADSRQVYRFMDIGTDKPSGETRARVPHHLIDMVDPPESYTLALYQEDAVRAITAVLSRGKLPVLAGGTPLYVNAVLEGWTIPRVQPDPALRRTLEAEAGALGPQALHARLQLLDPPAAAKILPTNTRRLVRALEVIMITGQSMSSQQEKAGSPYRVLTLGMRCERTDLYNRIDARVDLQFRRNLVGEVKSLLDRGYRYDLPSMSGLGYRQVCSYLRGLATLEEAVQRVKYDTHAFARHQLNWFKRAQDAAWLDVSDEDATKRASSALVESFLALQPDGGPVRTIV